MDWGECREVSRLKFRGRMEMRKRFVVFGMKKIKLCIHAKAVLTLQSTDLVEGTTNSGSSTPFRDYHPAVSDSQPPNSQKK